MLFRSQAAACAGSNEKSSISRKSAIRFSGSGSTSNRPNITEVPIGVRAASGRTRLESVQNAVDQATSVAKAICGKPEPYTAVPWFWSTQFDIHMQTAGLTHDYTETVVRGAAESNTFSVFYYRGGRLTAVDSINQAAEHMTARKLIGARANVTPTQAADEAFDLKSALL